MTTNQRQQARRMADRRRPVYRRAMYAAGIGAMLSAFAAGCAPGPMVRVLSISLAVLCAAYAVHFDGESRRIY